MIVETIRNKYGFADKIYLAYCLFITKIQYPKARLIRYPFHIRGKKYQHLGNHLTTGIHCRLEAYASHGNESTKLQIGNNVQLNDYVHISAMNSVSIGDDVLMASHVYISDNSHGCYDESAYATSPYIPPINRSYLTAPVVIGNRVWLGEGVIVMPGVTIGDGAVIGAHSIVNKNIPENCIAAGSPAKIIKKWDNNNKQWIKI